jgi:hypothetical protein
VLFDYLDIVKEPFIFPFNSFYTVSEKVNEYEQGPDNMDNMENMKNLPSRVDDLPGQISLYKKSGKCVYGNKIGDNAYSRNSDKNKKGSYNTKQIEAQPSQGYRVGDRYNILALVSNSKSDIFKRNP